MGAGAGHIAHNFDDIEHKVGEAMRRISDGIHNYMNGHSHIPIDGHYTQSHMDSLLPQDI